MRVADPEVPSRMAKRTYGAQGSNYTITTRGPQGNCRPEHSKGERFIPESALLGRWNYVLRFRGSNHIDASINLVLRSALARVSKDGHKRDRASGHPSRRSARKAARRAPQTVCPFLRGATHPRCGMRGLPG